MKHFNKIALSIENFRFTAQKTHYFYSTNISQLMLRRKIIDVCCDNSVNTWT